MPVGAWQFVLYVHLRLRSVSGVHRDGGFGFVRFSFRLEHGSLEVVTGDCFILRLEVWAPNMGP